MRHACQTAIYYFPNYHSDARNALVHGPGWTEWELVRHATPRWPGHTLPHTPAWGYADEADPAEMARKLTAAANHGIDAFIFDWYWYNDGPYLQRCLDEGYLPAAESSRVKFALMWANHDWTDIHPQKLAEKPRVLYPGAVTRETFDAAMEHVIARYFSRTSYWRLEGRPYFSVYDLPRLIAGLGGIANTAAALRWFRERTRAAGHPDLHLNLVLWQRGILAGETSIPVDAAMLSELGFDSLTSYVWIHHVPLEPFPVMPYLTALRRMLEYSDAIQADFPGFPYFPNVSMGWDPSARTVQSDVYREIGYPFTGTLGDNTPENFQHALERMKSWLDRRPAAHRVLTINAWNEWTEGSYLEPDLRHGFRYLEAVRAVFGSR